MIRCLCIRATPLKGYNNHHCEIRVTHTTDNLQALMQQSLKGDQRAYAALLQETSRLLRPFLAKRLSFTNEVDDLLQEILISIHKARHTYDGKRPYKPWAYAIAQFRLRDYLRAHYSDQLHRADDLSELEEYLHEEVTETAISYESISGEVQKLPEKQATILRLMHQEGYTAKEVAEKIGMKESAVKVAAHRAYKVLREKLKNEKLERQ
ncbi:MAG: sigma-70 family RNA polymerase sigma factor [Nitrosomonadales bacterium]|nr:sigma-70 family RNA polymerase sigma factor [Nitrosomonadales bacterium]